MNQKTRVALAKQWQHYPPFAATTKCKGFLFFCKKEILPPSTRKSQLSDNIPEHRGALSSRYAVRNQRAAYEPGRYH